MAHTAATHEPNNHRRPVDVPPEKAHPQLPLYCSRAGAGSSRAHSRKWRVCFGRQHAQFRLRHSPAACSGEDPMLRTACVARGRTACAAERAAEWSMRRPVAVRNMRARAAKLALGGARDTSRPGPAAHAGVPHGTGSALARPLTAGRGAHQGRTPCSLWRAGARGV